MVQTKEEKTARRKARRERRKAGLPPQTPALPSEEAEVPVAARKPYAGFEGTLFEKFTSEDGNNPECYRLYTEKLNILGVLEQDPETKEWFIPITRFPQDWEYEQLRFESLDLAMKCLYGHYSSLVIMDQKKSEEPTKKVRKFRKRRFKK